MIFFSLYTYITDLLFKVQVLSNQLLRIYLCTIKLVINLIFSPIRFSVSHDEVSLGNTSDNLEAVSEAASNHSVTSSLELETEDQNDNLSDMVSYYIYIFNFTMYPAHNTVGKGNL